MSSIFDLVNPGLFFAFDCAWVHPTIFGFLSTLLLPVLLIAILVSAMGGDTKNMGEMILDTVSTALVVLIDLSICVIKYFLLLLSFVFSAAFRTFAEYQSAARGRESVNVKSDGGPEYGAREAQK